MEGSKGRRKSDREIALTANFCPDKSALTNGATNVRGQGKKTAAAASALSSERAPRRCRACSSQS